MLAFSLNHHRSLNWYHPYVCVHIHQEATSGIGGMSLGRKEQEQKEKIARMRELTNADESTARFWLESFSWDLERVGLTACEPTHVCEIVACECIESVALVHVEDAA